MVLAEPEFFEQPFGLLRIIGVPLVQVDGPGHATRQHTHQRLRAALERHLRNLGAIQAIAAHRPARPHVVKGCDPHIEEGHGRGHFGAGDDMDILTLFEDRDQADGHAADQVDLARAQRRTGREGIFHDTKLQGVEVGQLLRLGGPPKLPKPACPR